MTRNAGPVPFKEESSPETLCEVFMVDDERLLQIADALRRLPPEARQGKALFLLGYEGDDGLINAVLCRSMEEAKTAPRLRF